MIPKGISQTSLPNPKYNNNNNDNIIYTVEKEITNSKNHLCISNLEI